MLARAICWALIAFLCLQPLRGRRRWRRFLARRTIAGERARMYRRSIALWWALTGLWVLALALAHQSFGGHELRAPQSTRGASDVAVAVGFVLALFVPLGFARWRRASLRSLGETAELLPRTPVERRWFFALALTAGFCEEAIYRSFALAMVTLYRPGAPLWVYFVVGSVPFGLAHLYQGRRGVVLTTLFGLWLTAVYLGFGSLWPAIVAHALLDLRAGALSWFLPSAEAEASGRAAA